MADALTVQNLWKKFGKVDVLRGLSFNVRHGQVVALMGPNGSGKTTLIRIVATVEKPSAGEVRVMGYDVVKQPKQIRELISYLPQESFLSYYLTGIENLMFYARLIGMGKREALKRCKELLETFGLSDDAGRKVGNYSGGMRRKLALASSLLASKPLLLMDEPTTGLDPVARRELLGLLLENAKDSSILLNTHIGDDAEIASNVIFIDRGKVVDIGSPSELKNKYVTGRTLHVKLHARLKKVEETLKSHSVNGVLSVTDQGYKVYTESYTADEIIERLKALGVQASVEESNPSLEDAFSLAVAIGYKP